MLTPADSADADAILGGAHNELMHLTELPYDKKTIASATTSRTATQARVKAPVRSSGSSGAVFPGDELSWRHLACASSWRTPPSQRLSWQTHVQLGDGVETATRDIVS